ncbi:MAG: hypothetical protein KGL99_12025 [Burkholderiales bacterium]|nr:hypothetical protein [Burkholderiales bacterium]MDE2296832.1 hypothetical protein [Burkholderiales bacterium]MDE2627871.1 hypothetical protein [Burkholderiales bacterium]
MKQQVVRFSPHQNGKVFAVLTAVGSLVVLVPMVLLFSVLSPSSARPPFVMLLTMPLMYLVFGYLMVAIGCALYNFMFRYVGGFEFQVETEVDPS